MPRRAEPKQDAPWRDVPRAQRYMIDGERYVQIKRDGRGVIVPLDQATEQEIAALREAT